MPGSVLPTPPTEMVGRAHAEAAVAHLLREEGARLVTLTGPGGVGKTRLALAVAQSLRSAYPDGAVFVDLSAVSDAGLVASALAQALGAREEGARGTRETLLAHLQDKSLLLILDNVEQVIAAGTLVAELVAACPRLAALVTSRTALRVRAEQQFRISPLDTPAGASSTVAEVAAYPAVQLFVARARAVAPDFQLDAGNAAVVAEICRRLDGLPLAIELAAARVALLPPAALLARLGPRDGQTSLRLLKGGARDVPRRQQTLRATIDWSYALLSGWEQALFRRLSVFAGGCALDAAEAMATALDAADAGVPDVLAGVGMLVDHGLLQSVTGLPAERGGGEPRFRMLETIRAYGLERLEAGGEEAEARQGHAAHYLALAEDAMPHLFGPDQVRWLALLEQDYDNLREALARARERGQAEQGARLAGALWRYWYIRCQLGEGRGWLQEFAAPESAAVASPARMDTLVGLAVIAYAQTDYDQAARAAEDGAALARLLNDQPNLAVLLNILGGVARYRSDFARAAALGEESVAVTRSIGDRWALALSLHNLADVARLRGTYERAAALAAESLALARALGDRWGIAQAFLTKGRIARDRGDDGEATALFGESLTIVQALSHTRDIALALAGLGDVAWSGGDDEQASVLYEESLALLRPLGDKIRTAHVLTALARVRHVGGDDERATALYHEGLTLFREVGSTLGLVESFEGLAAVAARTAPVPGGSATGQDGQMERAARLLAAAAALRETIGAPLTPVARGGHERVVAVVRAALGDDASAAWTAGWALSLESAVAEALAVR